MQNSLSLSTNEALALAKFEKTVTTKELAEILGVEVTAIKRAVQKLGAVLHQVKRNNQGGYLFTEEQATIIKQEIQKHHNLATRQIDTVSTELEENQTIANAMMILQRRSEELKRRAEIAEKQVEVMKPSATSWETYAGNMEHRNSEKSFREVAKLLNLNPQNCLTNWCEKNGYIYRNKGVYTASQKAITKGILVNRIVNAENGWSGEQCKITAYGMRFFSEMKEQGEFGYCVLTDKPEDGSNRPARPSRDYRKRGDK